MHSARLLLPLAFLFAGAWLAAATLSLTPTTPDGVYAPGAPIIWTIRAEAGAFTSGNYTIRRFGTEIAAGTIDLAASAPTLSVPGTAEPAQFRAELKATPAGEKELAALGGALVRPEGILQVVPRPADFDAFWDAKVAALRAEPPRVTVEATDSGNPAVLYYKITVSSLGGRTVHAQLARPASGDHFPAYVTMQGAGVYGLKKSNVVGPAASGWLALNIMPHDLPFDETVAFYQTQKDGPLKDYPLIGYEDRERSYFVGMILGNVRAADYLCTRPDWDGRTLLAIGTSQGGYQAIALAALEPRVTAVIGTVPACGDIAGTTGGRNNSFPYWLPTWAMPANAAAIARTSAYFDAAGFAPRVKVPALIGLGLIDTVVPPSNVYSVVNRLAGPKKVIIAPTAGHDMNGEVSAAMQTSRAAWLAALKAGAPLPLSD